MSHKTALCAEYYCTYLKYYLLEGLQNYRKSRHSCEIDYSPFYADPISNPIHFPISSRIKSASHETRLPDLSAYSCKVAFFFRDVFYFFTLVNSTRSMGIDGGIAV